MCRDHVQRLWNGVVEKLRDAGTFLMTVTENLK